MGSCIRASPPQVYHRLACKRHTDRCSHLAPLLEIAHKLVGDPLKLWVTEPTNLARVDTRLDRRETRHKLVLLCLLLLHYRSDLSFWLISVSRLLAAEKFPRQMDHAALSHSTYP